MDGVINTVAELVNLIKKSPEGGVTIMGDVLYAMSEDGTPLEYRINRSVFSNALENKKFKFVKENMQTQVTLKDSQGNFMSGGNMDLIEFFDLFRANVYYKDHDEIHDFYMSFQKQLKKMIETFFIHNKDFLEDLDKAHLREEAFVGATEEDISNWLQMTIGNSGRTYILEFLVLKHLITWFRGFGKDEMSEHFARVLQVQMKKFIAEAPHHIDEYWWKESFSNLLADYYFNRENGGGPFWC